MISCNVSAFCSNLCRSIALSNYFFLKVFFAKSTPSTILTFYCVQDLGWHNIRIVLLLDIIWLVGKDFHFICKTQ